MAGSLHGTGVQHGPQPRHLVLGVSGDFEAKDEGVVTKIDVWALQKDEWISFVISALISLYTQLLKQRPRVRMQVWWKWRGQ